MLGVLCRVTPWLWTKQMIGDATPRVPFLPCYVLPPGPQPQPSCHSLSAAASLFSVLLLACFWFGCFVPSLFFSSLSSHSCVLPQRRFCSPLRRLTPTLQCHGSRQEGALGEAAAAAASMAARNQAHRWERALFFEARSGRTQTARAFCPGASSKGQKNAIEAARA